MVIVAVISGVILMYCVANGTKILNIFNPQGEGVMQSYAPSAADKNNVQLNAVLTGEEAPAVTTQQPTGTANAAPSAAGTTSE